jgi:signal transduction histidine kinase
MGSLVPSLKQFFVYEGKSLDTISWRESVGVRSDGSELPIDLSLSPVALQERKFFTIIIHDATAKRKVDRLKNEFISTVSHELRTPLTSIKGALGIVLSGDLGELEGRSKDLLVIANNNADRLTRLVNDILDIDKLEFGSMQLNNQRMVIYQLLQQSVLQNQGYGSRYGVELVLDDVDGSVGSLCVNLDVDRFLQVMSNLLSNAIKYSHLGSQVRVNLQRAGSFVRISVIDQGQGIPESFRQHIFRKFAQADSSDTRKRDGTGLGLSITKAIVERLGGKIDYDSIEGEGATFYFTLPIAE